MKINTRYGEAFTILQFNDECQEIGRLSYANGQLQFEGNASEAAKQLFDQVIREFNTHLKLTEEQNSQLHTELLAMEHDRDRWKNHHNTEVQRARILKNRTDLPIERKMLYQALRSSAIAEGSATALDMEHVVTTEDDLNHLIDVHIAAQKLVNCKGRFHAEQNYKALAALFGVTLPEPRQSTNEQNEAIQELKFDTGHVLSDDEWNMLVELTNSAPAPSPALRELMTRKPRCVKG